MRVSDVGKTGNVSKHDSNIAMVLDEELWRMFTKQKVLIPIHHGKSAHYTLLYISHADKEFIHMNSCMKQKMAPDDHDPWTENAEAMVFNIILFLITAHLSQ